MRIFERSRAKVAVAGVLVLIAVGLAGWRWHAHRLGLSVERARNSLPAGVVGCWALHDDGGARAEAAYFQSPSIMRLEAEPHASASFHGSGTVRRVERFDSLGAPMDVDTARPAVSRSRRFTYWAADSTADRLRVRFSSGLSGTQFVFDLPRGGIPADTIRGRAISHWDFRRLNTDEGSMYAVRVSCPESGRELVPGR